MGISAYIIMGRMDMSNTGLSSIGDDLQQTVSTAEMLEAHGVSPTSVLSALYTAIRRTAHLDPGPGQQLGRAINRHDRALHSHSIRVIID
jgi:hypothetical protein